jgi:hypothetical protein
MSFSLERPRLVDGGFSVAVGRAILGAENRSRPKSREAKAAKNGVELGGCPYKYISKVKLFR